LQPASTLFLLCDVQERFRSLIYQAETVVNTSRYLVQISRELGIPVIATQQYTRAFGPTCPEIPLTAPEPEESGAPKATDIPVFEKKLFSMITDEVGTALDQCGPSLRSVVLFGQETHVCVQQTCLDLLERGLEVHVVADGCSSQRPTDREVALQRMAQSGAFVTTAESLVFMLMRSAAHPNFKKVSALTKAHFELPNGLQGGANIPPLPAPTNTSEESKL